jgi:hypothetical protein
MAELLRHGHRQCNPLIVALLQLDLLSGRLAVKKQPRLACLSTVLSCG